MWQNINLDGLTIIIDISFVQWMSFLYCKSVPCLLWFLRWQLQLEAYKLLMLIHRFVTCSMVHDFKYYIKYFNSLIFLLDCRVNWSNMCKNGSSKILWTTGFKPGHIICLKRPYHLNFFKPFFHNIYLVHSWINSQ